MAIDFFQIPDKWQPCVERERIPCIKKCDKIYEDVGQADCHRRCNQIYLDECRHTVLMGAIQEAALSILKGLG